MPQRAKVMRVWRLRKGISSGRPRHSGCDAAVEADRPTGSRRRAASTGPKAMRPAGVSTSTSGSSQNRPREPVRTISTATPCAARLVGDAPPRPCRRRRRGPPHRGGRRCASSSPDLARDVVDRNPASAAPSARRRASPTARRRTGPDNRSASTVSRPSGVVPPHSTPKRSRTLCATASPFIDWQASARHSFSTWRPAGLSRKS